LQQNSIRLFPSKCVNCVYLCTFFSPPSSLELDAKRAAAAGDNLDTKSGTESDPGVAPPFNSLGYSVEHMTKVQPPTLTAGGAYRTGTAPVGTQRPGTTTHATPILYVNNHSLVESGRDLEPRARPGTTITPTNQW
jgi:hypothetical protein